MTAGKNTLETSLRKVNEDLDVCRTHNGRLCAIADDLVKARARNGSFLQKEPLVQIKRIELEKITQDYCDKIDAEKLNNAP